MPACADALRFFLRLIPNRLFGGDGVQNASLRSGQIQLLHSHVIEPQRILRRTQAFDRQQRGQCGLMGGDPPLSPATHALNSSRRGKLFGSRSLPRMNRRSQLQHTESAVDVTLIVGQTSKSSRLPHQGRALASLRKSWWRVSLGLDLPISDANRELDDEEDVCRYPNL